MIGQPLNCAEEDREIGLTYVPEHVALIMDGNRRWAVAQRGLPVQGHQRGAEALIEIVRFAAQVGVRTLTVYAFSTENWTRPKVEVDALMDIVASFLVDKKEMMVNEGVCLNAIGDLALLPSHVQQALLEARKASEHGKRINLVLALNYGARDEIRRAVGQILARNAQKKIEPHELTEQFIAQFLDTSPWGDPELLIRTSGELRLSNFLLWQLSYSELYVTDVLWPDFGPKEFFQALRVYQNRKRRLGR